nr:capsid protein [Porcine associated circular DNA virus 6]
MPRKSYVKSSKRFSRTKGTRSRYSRFRRSGYRTLARRISAVSKRVAGEVCKFEITPDQFTNTTLSPIPNNTTRYQTSKGTPLINISSGTPWIMPINWFYEQASDENEHSLPLYYNSAQQPAPVSPVTVSVRNPIYYNTMPAPAGAFEATELQYRLKYIYINALFNASITQSENNTDGALRIVIVKDKQPTGGSATWYDENATTNSRGVFNNNRIDAQLNPSTVGRFKIMYDKTLRFNTINGYKPFKYFKRLSTTVRNNTNYHPVYSPRLDQENFAQTSDQAPPVQKNAYYIMIFSDGLNFTYSSDPSTPAASFHLFNRVAYYNN